MPVISEKYLCPKCRSNRFTTSSTRWECEHCGQAYPCVHGIPKLYIDENLGAQDRRLRDKFYDGVFGAFYAFMMPFIVMPVRPLGISWPHWAAYGGVWLATVALFGALLHFLVAGAVIAALIVCLPLIAGAIFFARQKYLFHLFLLAIPTKLSVLRSKFRPEESFPAAHERVLDPLRQMPGKLQILDVSTGSCNSLYKHGWMTLNGDYTAIDLSATMLTKGQDFMSRAGVPVDLVLGDALALPFQSESFDVVLNYGAINGMTDPGKALAEMARVAKPGGWLLFLDEQLYDAATPVERAYFERVLSSHNVVHHCPVELLPPELVDVRVSQVYQFYYLCTARKRARSGG